MAKTFRKFRDEYEDDEYEKDHKMRDRQNARRVKTGDRFEKLERDDE